MTVQITIIGEDENDFRRQLVRLAAPYFEGYVEANDDFERELEPTEPPSAAQASPLPEVTPDTPKRGGRPKGSTNKPKTNGVGAEPPQAEAQAPPANGALVELLPLSEQVQIITDAYNDDREKFRPLVAALYQRGGFKYVSRAEEKDRPVLQEFINEHGLAV